MENISPQRRYTRKFEMPTFRLGRKDPLEKEMAIHSSTIAWKIPWTEEPGRIQSMGSQSRTQLSNFTFTSGLGLLVEIADKNPS